MIRFQCTCGKRLKVEAAHAGQLVECTACGRKMRAPADPSQAVSGPEALAAAVRQFGAGGQADAAEEPTPADHAAAGLAALAGAANGSAPARPARTASSRASRPARGSRKTPVRPTDLLANRHPSVQTNRRPLFIAAGIALSLIVVIFIILAVSANMNRPAPAEPQETVHVPPPVEATHAPPPGELFPNVRAEAPSASVPDSGDKPN